MKRQWENLIKIVSLLPTPPGWKAVETWSSDGTYHHEECPIVGFATVRRFTRREGDVEWRQEDSDQVEPLLFNSEFNAALPISDYTDFNHHRFTTVVMPGETFDEQKAIGELKAKGTA